MHLYCQTMYFYFAIEAIPRTEGPIGQEGYLLFDRPFLFPNSADAQFLIAVLQISPTSKIVAVHLDAISHCTLKRKDLALFLEENHILDTVSIPINESSFQIIFSE